MSVDRAMHALKELAAVGHGFNAVSIDARCADIQEQLLEIARKYKPALCGACWRCPSGCPYYVDVHPYALVQCTIFEREAPCSSQA